MPFSFAVLHVEPCTIFFQFLLRHMRKIYISVVSKGHNMEVAGSVSPRGQSWVSQPSWREHLLSLGAAIL